MLWSSAFAEFTCIWTLAVQLNVLQLPDAYNELTYNLGYVRREKSDIDLYAN